jgi:hypothetical protein
LGRTELGSVHFPGRDLTARVLQQDVGISLAVVVARSNRFPVRPRIGAHRSTAALKKAGYKKSKNYYGSEHSNRGDAGLDGARLLRIENENDGSIFSSPIATTSSTRGTTAST